MLKLGIADECCEAIHIHLAMMQSMVHVHTKGE